MRVDKQGSRWKRKEGLFLILTLCFLFNVTVLFAKSTVPITSQHVDLKLLLPHLLQIDNRIKAAEYELTASYHGVDEEKAKWLPAVNLTGFTGNQDRHTPTGDTDVGYNQETAKVTQLIYDFGKTRSAIIGAKEVYQQKKLDLEGVRQQVLLEGATAYLNLLGANKNLNYAQYNENNVIEQLEMELKRVKTGSGYSTDVLEAEAQLQGAKARVVRAEGQLIITKNNFSRIFKEPPFLVETFRQPTLPKQMPNSEEEAVQIAMRHNPEILNLYYEVAIAKQEVKSSKAEFFPKIDAIYEAKRKWNVDGVLGEQEERDAKVDLNYPIFSGGGGLAAMHAAANNLEAAEQELYNQELVVEEEVRNDWDALRTSKENALFLKKQATTLKRFLELAMKERQLGRKSLLELLVADTNYVDALSAAIASRVNVSITGYKLLKDMGILNVEMFIRSSGYVKHPPILHYRKFGKRKNLLVPKINVKK